MSDIKKINASIAMIRKTGAALDALIQNTACDIIEHVSEHRNTTLITQLVSALPRGAKVRQLADWFTRMLPDGTRVGADGKISGFPKADTEVWTDWVSGLDMDSVRATPWYEKAEKAEKAAPTFTKVVDGLIKTANREDLDADTQAAMAELVNAAIAIRDREMVNALREKLRAELLAEMGQKAPAKKAPAKKTPANPTVHQAPAMVMGAVN